MQKGVGGRVDDSGVAAIERCPGQLELNVGRGRVSGAQGLEALMRLEGPDVADERGLGVVRVRAQPGKGPPLEPVG